MVSADQPEGGESQRTCCPQGTVRTPAWGWLFQVRLPTTRLLFSKVDRCFPLSFSISHTAKAFPFLTSDKMYGRGSGWEGAARTTGRKVTEKARCGGKMATQGYSGFNTAEGNHAAHILELTLTLKNYLKSQGGT